MFLEKLLHAIGSIFAGLFNSARKTWKHLSPEVQAALIHGSAIVDIINSNIDHMPDFVIELITQKYPELDREKLHEALSKVAVDLKIVEANNSDDLATVIQNIQTYLGGLKGKIWAAVSHSIAATIAIVEAPPETKFAAVSSLLEYVYHAIIKKNKDAAPTA